MTDSTARIIWSTHDGERLIAYCARVSSSRQDNPAYEDLLRYCVKHKHWSIFEMASMCVEITTSRAIAAQILRHKSFSFQEFSQRYSSEDLGIEVNEARRQDKKNRQNSIDDLPESTRNWWRTEQQRRNAEARVLYERAIDLGIAKECARFVLPLSTRTRLYMVGSVRSWIHYLDVRTAPETQQEHRDLALIIKTIFDVQYPTIADALKKEI
jgi:thymidylate synthase (FAD)